MWGMWSQDDYFGISALPHIVCETLSKGTSLLFNYLINKMGIKYPLHRAAEGIIEVMRKI